MVSQQFLSSAARTAEEAEETAAAAAALVLTPVAARTLPVQATLGSTRALASKRGAEPVGSPRTRVLSSGGVVVVEGVAATAWGTSATVIS